jgi:2-(1,2-epoxy-1,2-dihydrophenyl)acetyl-CoA isomerase
VSAEALVLWHEENRVGYITLNRPDGANALSTEMARALCAAIDRARRADIDAVLLSARGKQFCAGGDIREFVARQDDLASLVNDILALVHPAIQTLAELPLPVVSALQGPIGGAGIAVALCADIVLAAPQMKLRGGYSAIGLSPDLGASYFLARRAGSARAKTILMTNRSIPAEQCLQWGLVDQICAAEALQSRARGLAEQLAHGARGSLAGIKWLCDHAFEHDLATHLRLEREALVRAAGSSDAHEGVRAFVEKREPRFSQTSAD